jgi:CHAT domain-containing protein
MDFWGTQLAVLSACETGRGTIRTGQGVYGLRRAFLIAGVETLVTSLWQVDDEATSELMVAFYQQVLAGTPRIGALRAAMLKLKRHRPHPYHWAAFVGIGRDAPVVLKRSPAVTQPGGKGVLPKQAHR